MSPSRLATEIVGVVPDVLVKILCLLVALNKHGGYIDISKLFMGITMLAHLYNLASVGAHPVN